MTVTRHSDSTRLSVLYVDDRSGQVQQVSLWVEQGMLQLAGQGLLRQIPLHQIDWSDPNSHGRLIAQLPKGVALHAQDKMAWLQWRSRANIPEKTAKALTNDWCWSIIAALLLLTICASTYVFAWPRNQG